MRNSSTNSSISFRHYFLDFLGVLAIHVQVIRSHCVIFFLISTSLMLCLVKIIMNLIFLFVDILELLILKYIYSIIVFIELGRFKVFLTCINKHKSW